MRILIASHIFPGPDVAHAGGQVIYHVIHELTARGHDVDVLSKILPHEQGHVEALRKVCHEVITIESGMTKRQLALNSLHTGFRHPLDLIRWRGRRNNLLVAYLLDALLDRRHYDLVQLDLVQMLPLARAVRGRAPVLQVIHDLESKLAYRRVQVSSGLGRLLRGLDWQRVLRAELCDLRRCAGIAAHGALDLEMLHALLPEKPLIRGPLWLPLHQPLPYPLAAPPRVIFVGALWRAVNDEAARRLLVRIWPQVHAQLPDARLLIAGSGASPALIELARGTPNVMLTGYVEDLIPWYAQSHVAIAPVRYSGGVLLKVLDAMALGRPVVTTYAGNEGVGAQPEHDLIVVDDPEEMADAVVELLRSPARAARLAMHGREFVQSTFDWVTSFDTYERFVTALAGSPPALVSQAGRAPS